MKVLSFYHLAVTRAFISLVCPCWKAADWMLLFPDSTHITERLSSGRDTQQGDLSWPSRDCPATVSVGIGWAAYVTGWLYRWLQRTHEPSMNHIFYKATLSLNNAGDHWDQGGGKMRAVCAGFRLLIPLRVFSTLEKHGQQPLLFCLPVQTKAQCGPMWQLCLTSMSKFTPLLGNRCSAKVRLKW